MTSSWPALYNFAFSRMLSMAVLRLSYLRVALGSCGSVSSASIPAMSYYFRRLIGLGTLEDIASVADRMIWKQTRVTEDKYSTGFHAHCVGDEQRLAGLFLPAFVLIFVLVTLVVGHLRPVLRRFAAVRSTDV